MAIPRCIRVPADSLADTGVASTQYDTIEPKASHSLDMGGSL